MPVKSGSVLSAAGIFNRASFNRDGAQMSCPGEVYYKRTCAIIIVAPDIWVVDVDHIRSAAGTHSRCDVKADISSTPLNLHIAQIGVGEDVPKRHFRVGKTHCL